MTIQATGVPISMSHANVEVGNASNAQISFSSSKFRSLLRVPSGQTLLSTGYGKEYAFRFNPAIASNVNSYNLKSSAISAGWDQVLPLKAAVTINSGVIVGASSTGVYAFDTGVTFPGGTTLSIINNGSILGAGGTGGGAGNVGSTGGTALLAQFALSITNNGTVGGGGGGGGAGGGWYVTANTTYHPEVAATPYTAAQPAYWDGSSTAYAGGSGGGGGAGIAQGPPGAAYGNSSPGAEAGAGNGAYGTSGAGGGGGGPGYAYTASNGYYGYGGVGGAGGGLGAAGGGGSSTAGQGGGYPVIGYGVWYNAAAGGAAGSCTGGNSNITWVAAGSRFGALN